MTRTMTMTLKAVGAGRGATMARTRAEGTQFVRRVVGFAIVTSSLVAIASQAMAHLIAH
ncbi:hypothetical protein [Paraburkholderia sp. J67]|uniref:hypothetical protein n=1 Tax=Paraburkholderia sp. J67 TaxID=2805435 RepID=UPI002ABDD2B2|nr:hypothetical protein [Paraburkholderia sp. J67]